MTARREKSSPFATPCAACGAQPGRYCLPSPQRSGPYHAERRQAWLASLDTTGTAQPAPVADATPAVDVTALRRERDVAVAALRRIDRAGSVADARYAARRALLALGLGDDEGPRAPMEVDADLRARLARDSAALHDPMEAAR